MLEGEESESESEFDEQEMIERLNLVTKEMLDEIIDHKLNELKHDVLHPLRYQLEGRVSSIEENIQTIVSEVINTEKRKMAEKVAGIDE